MGDAPLSVGDAANARDASLGLAELVIPISWVTFEWRNEYLPKDQIEVSIGNRGWLCYFKVGVLYMVWHKATLRQACGLSRM